MGDLLAIARDNHYAYLMPYALQVRLTDDQETKLRKLAEDAGLSLSAYVRSELLRLAKKTKNSLAS